MVVGAGSRWIFQHAQAAGHSQMDDQRAARRRQQQIFSAPAHAVDLLPRELSVQAPGHDPAELSLPNLDPADGDPFQPGFYAAARRFNLR